MMRHSLRVWQLAAAFAAAGGLVLAGCGEKIAIPEPVGSARINKYFVGETWQENDVRQLIAVQGRLFVVTAEGLLKRNLSYEEQERVTSLADPRALCTEDSETWIFVWEQGARQISWFRRDSLSVGGGATALTGPARVTAMATSPVGVDTVPGAMTFVYLADPDSGVVWRYAFSEISGLTPYGLLARSRGSSVRDVHVAAGMVRDDEGFLLVCDRDTLRNWVTRFDPTPQETDADLRGRAALYRDGTVCQPVPAAEDYVIGNAPRCGGDDWLPGTSGEDGEFHTPHAVAVDGSGRIFVADTGNDRVQLFGRGGVYDLQFGDAEITPGPVSIAVVDRPGDGGRMMFGAQVFLVLPDEALVRSFSSAEYDEWVNRRPRPPE